MGSKQIPAVLFCYFLEYTHGVTVFVALLCQFFRLEYCTTALEVCLLPTDLIPLFLSLSVVPVFQPTSVTFCYSLCDFIARFVSGRIINLMSINKLLITNSGTRKEPTNKHLRQAPIVSVKPFSPYLYSMPLTVCSVWPLQ